MAHAHAGPVRPQTPMEVPLRTTFERTTAHMLTITFGTANVLKLEIEAAETFDVSILEAKGLEKSRRKNA